MLITPELIARIEAFHRDFNIARVDALRGVRDNPFGARRQAWDSLIAYQFDSPLLRGKNRIGGLTDATLPFLDDALAFYADRGITPTVSVPHGGMSQTVFRALVARGYWSGGSGTVPALLPREGIVPVAIPNVTVRPSPREEQNVYLNLFQEAFGERGEAAPQYARIQWAEDTLPVAYRYIAEWGGNPVGMASLLVMNGVGYCGTAGVLPDFQGRGIQQAMLARRVADAPALGADLVIGGGSLFSTTHRNFERVGMRLVPLGSGWMKMTA